MARRVLEPTIRARSGEEDLERIAEHASLQLTLHSRNSNSNRSKKTKRQPSEEQYCRDFQKGKCTRSNCKLLVEGETRWTSASKKYRRK
jgi:hypothetical protein